MRRDSIFIKDVHNGHIVSFILCLAFPRHYQNLEYIFEEISEENDRKDHANVNVNSLNWINWHYISICDCSHISHWKIQCILILNIPSMIYDKRVFSRRIVQPTIRRRIWTIVIRFVNNIVDDEEENSEIMRPNHRNDDETRHSIHVALSIAGPNHH